MIPSLVAQATVNVIPGSSSATDIFPTLYRCGVDGAGGQAGAGHDDCGQLGSAAAEVGPGLFEAAMRPEPVVSMVVTGAPSKLLTWEDTAV
jgi:hypothetical protein